MEKTDEEFLEKLLETFRAEAEDHLRTIAVTLTALEQSPEPELKAKLLETLFREVHSLKGAARSVNQPDLEKACQAFESVCANLKAGATALTRELFDQLHRRADQLASLVHDGEKQPAASLPACRAGEHPPLELVHTMADALAKTVRIPAARLNAILLQCEEMRSVGLGMGQRARELRALGESVAASRRTWEKERPELRPFFRNLSDGISSAVKAVEREQRAFRGMLETLLDDVRKALMLPASSLLEMFPKLARDLSNAQGKRVDLIVRGGEVEIDRRILEEIKDPLIHLARNAIDHGVEKPEARQAAGKPPAASLAITVSAKTRDQAEIEVIDDGAGIDRHALVESAVRAGLLSRENASGLSSQEAFSLVFRSGVSTAAVVTDLSGRGIGLAIAKEKAERLGGVITVESREGKGTAFRIALPATLATFRGILVESRGRPFVIPTANVERVLRVKREDVKTVEGRDTIPFDGGAVAFVRLDEALRLPAAAAASDLALAAVLRVGQRRIAFGVDGIRGEQDVLVKQLGRQLKSVPGIYGATVLGDGSVVPILHVPDLMKSAVEARG
ncbi:MAG: chemotaxis protein CheW [Deltaproteobacteria bacterium]|nr:chemotaxis protein CheW [Deltaproteobacteria bacterium]